MLTTAAKNWLAEHAGLSGCFEFTGISYTDPDGTPRTGSTGDVFNAFVVAHMIGKDSVIIKDNTNYTQLKAINNNSDMDITDVAFVYNNDGVPSSEPKYCKSVSTDVTDMGNYLPGCGGYGPSSSISEYEIKLVNGEYGDGLACASSPERFFTTGESIYVALKEPIVGLRFKIWGSDNTAVSSPIEKISDLVYKVTAIRSHIARVYLYGNGSPSFVHVSFSPPPGPTPSPTPTPPIEGAKAGTFEFVAPPSGDPTITLSLTNLVMRQTGDGHFEMNNISITNTSDYPIYIAIRIKIFEGTLPVCRPTGFVFDGIDRTDTKYRTQRIKAMEIGETINSDADFFQPPNILGTHTICMLIHGAWTRDDLQDEIDPITG